MSPARTATHADLVLIAARWLRQQRHTVVVCEMACLGTPERPDAIGWRDGWSTVVECKVSRADFCREGDKTHSRIGTSMGQRRYYLAPRGVIPATSLPTHAGLVEYDPASGECTVLVEATVMPLTDAAQRAELAFLAAAVRRHERGVPWDARRARFSAYRQPRTDRRP